MSVYVEVAWHVVRAQSSGQSSPSMLGTGSLLFLAYELKILLSPFLISSWFTGTINRSVTVPSFYMALKIQTVVIEFASKLTSAHGPLGHLLAPLKLLILSQAA